MGKAGGMGEVDKWGKQGEWEGKEAGEGIGGDKQGKRRVNSEWWRGVLVPAVMGQDNPWPVPGTGTLGARLRHMPVHGSTVCICSGGLVGISVPQGAGCGWHGCNLTTAKMRHLHLVCGRWCAPNLLSPNNFLR